MRQVSRTAAFSWLFFYCRCFTSYLTEPRNKNRAESYCFSFKKKLCVVYVLHSYLCKLDSRTERVLLDVVSVWNECAIIHMWPTTFELIAAERKSHICNWKTITYSCRFWQTREPRAWPFTYMRINPAPKGNAKIYSILQNVCVGFYIVFRVENISHINIIRFGIYWKAHKYF